MYPTDTPASAEAWLAWFDSTNAPQCRTALCSRYALNALDAEARYHAYGASRPQRNRPKDGRPHPGRTDEGILRCKPHDEPGDDADLRGWFKALGPPPTGRASPSLRVRVFAQIREHMRQRVRPPSAD
jgi:hypothetical protein